MFQVNQSLLQIYIVGILVVDFPCRFRQVLIHLKICFIMEFYLLLRGRALQIQSHSIRGFPNFSCKDIFGNPISRKHDSLFIADRTVQLDQIVCINRRQVLKIQDFGVLFRFFYHCRCLRRFHRLSYVCFFGQALLNTLRTRSLLVR